MRLRLLGVAAALLALPAIHPATAAAGQVRISDATTVSSDMSAQKKKKVTVYRYRYRNLGYRYVGDPTRSPYYLRPGVAPSFGYVGPPGYAGEYAWRRSIGQCVEDLGYGRWAACGSR